MYRVVAATYGTLCERTFGFGTFKWSSDDYCYSDESDYSLGLETAAKELYATYSDFCKQPLQYQLSRVLIAEYNKGENELSLEYDAVFRFFITEAAQKAGRKGLE